MTAPALAVRAPSVDFKGTGTRAHGRMADGGSPQSGLEARMRWSADWASGGASVL
jgi:hypothetical protein